MRGPRALEVPPGAAAARSGARRGGPRTEDAPEAARASTAPPPPGAQPLCAVRAPAEGARGPGQAPLRDPAAYPATGWLCAGSPAAFGLGRSLSAACAET
ncbi:hypothetical protein LUU34_01378500 [Aix galericulata]|nr:hypothetical protein LUU34_01378500 [Aix galericulata]